MSAQGPRIVGGWVDEAIHYHPKPPAMPEPPFKGLSEQPTISWTFTDEVPDVYAVYGDLLRAEVRRQVEEHERRLRQAAFLMMGVHL